MGTANALIVGQSGTGMSQITNSVAYQATLIDYDVFDVEADSAFSRVQVDACLSTL